MNWIELTQDSQLDEIKRRSATLPQLIFKHSTRCSISHVSFSRLNKVTQPESLDCYLLDLLNYRNISNKIAEDFSVYHESPQVLLIKNGECVYDESHTAISMDDIVEQANL